MLQRESLSTGLPIENSPPGIQTMPAGAAPGAGVGFGIVRAKEDAVAVTVDSSASEGGAVSVALSRDHEVFVA
jgi:hypothetical protein